MMKVIDLDLAGKDGDGLIVTVTVGAEKVGVTEPELVEMIKARYAAGGRGGKRQPAKRTAVQDTLIPESGLNGDGEMQQGGEDPAH